MSGPTRLTEHFTLDELTASDAAVRLGIPNTPSPSHLANLKRMAACLEDARVIVGRPLHVTSGYRCPAVNRAVGGVPTSAHALGYAADVRVDGVTPLALAHALRDGGLCVDQLIVEADRGVVHLSCHPRMRMQFGCQAGAAGTHISWHLPLEEGTRHGT